MEVVAACNQEAAPESGRIDFESSVGAPTWRACARPAQESAKATAHEIDELLTDRFTPPRDELRGGSASSIEAAFEKYFEGTGRKVTGEIVTRLDDTTGEVWSVVVRKDRLDGNRYKFDVSLPGLKGKLRLARVSRR